MRLALALIPFVALIAYCQAGLKFESAIENIPFPAKKEKGGEDAFFTSDYVVAVADGVGGWNARGVDPAKYSKKLTANTKDLVSENPMKYRRNPKALLIEAAQRNKETGSSTFLIATIDPETNGLRTSYIGDSSYILLRPNKSTGFLEKVYRSKEQQHRFNFPFQIGSIGDEPTSAVEFSHAVEENDILVLGTDGLFDNLFNTQIISVLNSITNDTLEAMAKRLGDLAFKKSLDTGYDSPFARGARKAGFYFVGGKSDDITVVVARVVKEVIASSN